MTKVYTIGIGGHSCSGKTFEDDVPIDKESQLANWDCPEAIDFDRLLDIVIYAKKNDGKLPEGFDSNEENNLHDGSNQLDDETALELRQKLSGFIEKDDYFIIVDGFMLYWDDRIIDELDCKISLKTSYETAKSRREERQGYHTQEGYWIDPPGYFDKIVWPEYLRLREHEKALRELLVIDTDKNSIKQMALMTADKLNKDLL